MAYKEVKTTGPIEWARLFEDDRDMEGFEGSYVKTDGAYTVNQILSKEEYEKLTKAQSMKKPNQKRLMDGELVIKFVRSHNVTNKEGKYIAAASGAPKVFDPEGKPFDKDIWGPIGNGSTAEVTNLVSTFKTSEGKTASRTSLVSIKIIDFVPAPEREDEEEAA